MEVCGQLHSPAALIPVHICLEADGSRVGLAGPEPQSSSPRFVRCTDWATPAFNICKSTIQFKDPLNRSHVLICSWDDAQDGYRLVTCELTAHCPRVTQPRGHVPHEEANVSSHQLLANPHNRTSFFILWLGTTLLKLSCLICKTCPVISDEPHTRVSQMKTVKLR
jgi:hypothetical protein